MKKAIALLLALVTLLSLTACARQGGYGVLRTGSDQAEGGAGGRHLRGLPTL